MRDRLIELIQQADAICGSRKQCEGCVGFGKGADCVDHHIAAHLLASGVIVPPCKVGDVVYEIQPIRKRAQAYEITTIKYNGHYWWFTWILKDRKGIYGNVEGFSSHQIGKNVFLTKELAEEALKNEQEKL